MKRQIITILIATVLLFMMIFLFGCSREELGAGEKEVLGYKVFQENTEGLLGADVAVEKVKYAYKADKLEDDKNEIKELRTKTSKTYEEEGKKWTEFVSLPKYYKDSLGEWWNAEYETVDKEIFDSEILKISKKKNFFAKEKLGADESTFYPDGASPTDDGYLRATGVNETWTNMVNDSSASTVSMDTTNTIAFLISSDGVSNTYDFLSRGGFCFPTATIPDTDTIDSATLSFVGDSKYNQFTSASFAVNVYSFAPASYYSFTGTDYANFGSTEFSTSVAYDDFVVDDITYTDFELNASGIANISKTDVTCFGLREANYDAPDSAPTWSSNDTAQILVHASEGLVSYPPKLTVLHNASGETTDVVYASSSDGYVKLDTSPATWADVRDAATGDWVDNTADRTISNRAGTYFSGYEVYRSYYYFDLSGLDDNNVTYVRFKIWGYNASDSQMVCQLGTQADTLTTADFDSFSGTEYGHTTAFAQEEYNEIVFNAQGISDVDAVMGNGIFKLACRDYTYDYLDSAPGAVYQSNSYYSEYTSTTKDPYLIIVSETGAAPVTETLIEPLFFN